jgi:hypothetical protein
MTIDETIRAIQCCTSTPPKCGECPEHGPGFGIACRQDIRKWSVRYYIEDTHRRICEYDMRIKALESGMFELRARAKAFAKETQEDKTR